VLVVNLSIYSKSVDLLPSSHLCEAMNKVGCQICKSTGQRNVRAGQNTIYQHKKARVEALAQGLVPPPWPKRTVKCDVCDGLGIVDGDIATFKPAFVGKIAVIGGGIGGIAFALAAKQRGLDVTVYEKDSSFATRSQVRLIIMHKSFSLSYTSSFLSSNILYIIICNIVCFLNRGMH
jgi:hypothetical protein